MKENEGRGYVLGRQLFIELWSLLGMEPMVCETASEFPACFSRLQSEDTAFVLVESDWFENIPEIYKRKIRTGENPVWVEMPSLKSSVKSWE
jgi:vacuolar-type H+-ATPase subunit F/Vma7